jgi:hypothetical protein
MSLQEPARNFLEGTFRKFPWDRIEKSAGVARRVRRLQFACELPAATLAGVVKSCMLVNSASCAVSEIGQQMSEKFETFRDYLLSLYQSAVTDVARQIDNRQSLTGLSGPGRGRPAASVLPGIAADIARREQARRQTGTAASGPSIQELTLGDRASVCAELAFRYLQAKATGDEQALAQLKQELTAGPCDPAWATTLEEYFNYFGVDGQRRSIPYIRAAEAGPKVIEIKADARVALVGDWGTGAEPALVILKHIAARKPDVFVHLGDVYYSGTPKECKSNFSDVLGHILRAGSSKPLVFTLAGNHDMYCGGIGYYELIKTLNPAPFAQRSSFFCLRSADERWQLLAMDTGLHDYNPLGVAEAVTFVEDDELDWHRDRIREFRGRTILLSHHQMFSAFSAIGEADENGKRSAVNPKLLKAFQSLSAAGRISAWFWGHEHKLGIYNEFAGLTRGRCLGHGAVPTSILDKIYDPLEGLDKIPSIVANTKLSPNGEVYAHGYAVLSFKVDVCSAEYFQGVGEQVVSVWSEEFS